MGEDDKSKIGLTGDERDPQAAPVVRVGEKVGRFSILSEVGSGGMGRIYEAYDPDLDRKIALKLLHDSGEDGQRDRLGREAKALARLDHPNVVTVHDVGVYEGKTFVAMELVRGGTLKDWLAANPVGRKERYETAMRLLVDAGRGLIAAHAAGLVHRDVKPSNILIGDDERARVADFGIARGIEAPESPSESGDALMFATDDSASGHTGTGTSVGTPAYMAPEQFGRGRVDAAADQFSFCVTAWEVLFGARPFAVSDPRERLAAIRDGAHPLTADVAVDADIESLLRRGLRYEPGERYHELAELIDALSRTRGGGEGSGHPRWQWGVLGVGVVVLGAGGAYYMGQTDQTCTGAAAAFEEVWNEGRRESLRQAVLGSDLQFAPGAWARLEGGLDQYGEDWRAAHTEACQATEVRGEQSAEHMEERLACLEYAKRSVDAAVELASSGQASVIANEHELRRGLPRVETCVGAHGIPTSTEWAMLDTVTRAAALRSAGHSRQALEVIAPVGDALEPETAPVVRARVLLELGRGLSATYHPSRGIESLIEAHSAAHAAKLSSLSADSAREVAVQQARSRAEPDTVEKWLDVTRSEAAPTSASGECALLAIEGMILILRGKSADAVGPSERCVELAKGDPSLLPHALGGLLIRLEQVDPERALEIGRQALQAHEAHFGAAHPGAATYERNLSRSLTMLRRGAEAEEVAQRALDRATETWGEGHLATSPYLEQLARVRCWLVGDLEGGRELAEAAVQLYAKDVATDGRALALGVLSSCVEATDHEAWVDVARQAWQVKRELHGEDGNAAVLALATYASALAQTDDLVEAGKHLSLASALADEHSADWGARDRTMVHSALAQLATMIFEGEIAIKHGEAALASLEGAESMVLGAAYHAHRTLCDARISVGDGEGALGECLIALELTKDFEDEFDMAIIEERLGEILNALGRSEDALPHGQNAFRIYEELVGADSHLAGLGEFGLGRIYEDLGQYSKAELHYRKSFELNRAISDEPVRPGAGLARVVAELGRFDEAWALLTEVEALCGETDSFHRGVVLESRGYLLHLQDPKKGVREYEQALELFRFAAAGLTLRTFCRECPFDLPGCEELDLPN